MPQQKENMKQNLLPYVRVCGRFLKDLQYNGCSLVGERKQAGSPACKSRTKLHRANHWVVDLVKEGHLGVSSTFKSGKTYFKLTSLDLT